MRSYALSVFHRPPENWNCAQAVLDAWQSLSGRTVAPVASFRAHGGGRAPAGECGALYAACVAVPEAAEELRELFAVRAGATTCRALKGELRLPCAECVGIAADLLSERLPTLP
jgi:hypothetical protein